MYRNQTAQRLAARARRSPGYASVVDTFPTQFERARADQIAAAFTYLDTEPTALSYVAETV